MLDSKNVISTIALVIIGIGYESYWSRCLNIEYQLIVTHTHTHTHTAYMQQNIMSITLTSSSEAYSASI